MSRTASMDTKNGDIGSLCRDAKTPLFKEQVRVGIPNIGNHDSFLARVTDALDNKMLSNQGPYVCEFEKRLANYLGVKHVISMCNGTVALQVAASAIGLTGEVIVPSFTFVATPHSLQWLKIKPIFCDVDPITHNIDPGKIEALITPRTTGILAVHLWGRPCEIDKLEAICEKHNLQLLFDASHAFGCSYNGKKIGNHGCAESFSFHATKFLNTLEGGAVATNDDALAEKMKHMRNFGFETAENVVCVGTNGKMNEISAAMGLTSLESMGSFIETNKRNYQQYSEEFETIPGFSMIQYSSNEDNNFQYIIVVVDSEISGLTCDQTVELLWSENVMVRRYFYPGCHEMEPYRSCSTHAGLHLQETERLAKKVIAFPNGTSVDPSMISTICGLLRLAVNVACDRAEVV